MQHGASPGFPPDAPRGDRVPSSSDRWAPIAAQLRADSIRATTAAGSGHPTSSMSAADLMAVLLADHLHYDWKAPRSPDNDRLIFSKGHASPLLYAMFKAAGAIADEELLTLRKLGSRIEGHPTPRLPWVDVATGSLGQGLPAAVGMALGARLLDRDLRCWVLLGDSEMAEGSVYEAMELAGFYGLKPGHRHRRHEPPRAARPHHGAVGRRAVRVAGARLRLERRAPGRPRPGGHPPSVRRKPSGRLVRPAWWPGPGRERG